MKARELQRTNGSSKRRISIMILQRSKATLYSPDRLAQTMPAAHQEINKIRSRLSLSGRKECQNFMYICMKLEYKLSDYSASSELQIRTNYMLMVMSFDINNLPT